WPPGNHPLGRKSCGSPSTLPGAAADTEPSCSATSWTTWQLTGSASWRPRPWTAPPATALTRPPGPSGSATASCTSTRSTRCLAGKPATQRQSTWPHSVPPGDNHVSQPRLAKAQRVTVSSMAEEWRVSLVIAGRGGAIKGSHYRDLLRNRLGDDIAVSATKTHLYLYAESVKAAEEAGQVGRAVFEEQGQFAEVRLERWDSSGGEWRDPDEPA